MDRRKEKMKKIKEGFNNSNEIFADRLKERASDLYDYFTKDSKKKSEKKKSRLYDMFKKD